MNKFYNSKFYNFLINHRYFLLLNAILICMSLFLYREYVFGGKLFLFEDFGSDSVRVSLPTYIYFFDWFRSGMPLWSDKMGIGTSILSHADIIFDPFTYILYAFGKSKIIYMFVYMVVIKIILSGIFFWIFLGKYKLSPYAKIIGAITYAFGGYMIVMGQNYVFGTIYVYLPLILLGFEMWLQDKKAWLLILMLTLTVLYFYYFFYMTAIYFFMYSIFRYFTIYNFKIKHFLKYIFSLAGYGMIAMGLSAFYWLPSLALTFNNLRVGPSLPPLENMFIFNSSMVLTTLGRLFGYDTLGSPTIYLGYGTDYFQLATFFGIITIVLIPQIFCETNRRKKIAYGIFFIVILALLFIPFFSYLFNGFSDFTYRWIYIINFSLALLLSIAVNLIYEKMRINYKILFITAISLCAISLIVIDSLSPLKGENLYSQLRLYKNFEVMRNSLLYYLRIYLKDYFFIALYVVLTILFFRTRFKKIIKIIILGLICLELIWFPSYFINDRLTTNPDPVKNKLGYYDNTNSAVRYLKKIDNSIYRLDKSYDSVKSEFGMIPSDNESMVQDYMGLKSYNANNQPNYIRFLQYSDIFVKYYKYIPPKGMRPEDIKDPNLNYINGVGNRYLLQSFLGVKYYLTKGGVKPPSYYRYLTTIQGIDIYKNYYSLPLGFTFDRFITQDEFMSLNSQKKDLALLSLVVVDNINNLSSILVKDNIKRLNDIKSEAEISELIKQRRTNDLKLTSYKDDNITGKISVRNNKILVLTVPYDEGWTIYIDGSKNTPLKVDNGLIGIKLSPGNHIVQLKYFPPMMKLGIIISISTLLLFALLMIYKKILLKITSLIYKQPTVFYNDYARKPYDILKKLISAVTMTMNKPFLFMSKIIFKLSNKSGLNVKKVYFYITTISGVLIFILGGLITRGYSFYNLFQSNKSDYFMDFYNPLSELFNGPYTHGSIYPPLPLLIFKFILRLIPYDIASKGPSIIRSTQSGEIVFLLFMLMTLLMFFILIMEIKKGTKIEKYIFSFVILLSAPFLFEFERANIIFLALLLLMVFVFFKDNKNRFIRELALISLAASAGIKIYPAIFVLMLIKEKRFKDALKVFFYIVTFLILPVIMIGGISQLLILIKNIFTTSDGIYAWGVGYAVSIENFIRIIGAFYGNFGAFPILIGKTLSFLIFLFGIISVFSLHPKWKTTALLSLLMIAVPSISFEYVLIFMIIPLIMFLDSEERIKKSDYLYLTCFILIFIPFTLGNVDSINNGFGGSMRPLTYGVLIQNIALFTMVSFLIIQGLREKLRN